ncbi:MAG: baeRF7 domain-containing protein, partial [Coriobacteriia bacterium]
MADTLNRDELIELAGHVEWPAVSIHLPVHPYGPEAAQDTIRFKNQLRAASEALSEQMRGPEAEALLKPGFDLLDDPSFWRGGFAGLAVFISSAGSRVVKTPETIAELVSVSDRFSLRPLIAALGDDRPFYVLALTRNNSRLLKADRAGLTEIDLGDTPVSVADTLAYDDIERGATFQYRTPTGAGSRNGTVPAYHGHGAASKDKLANVTRFINQ